MPMQWKHARGSAFSNPLGRRGMFSLLGQFGNSVGGILRYAGINDLDFSLLKDPKLRGSMGLEFRTEFFNILGHAQLGATGL